MLFMLAFLLNTEEFNALYSQKSHGTQDRILFLPCMCLNVLNWNLH